MITWVKRLIFNGGPREPVSGKESIQAKKPIQAKEPVQARKPVPAKKLVAAKQPELDLYLSQPDDDRKILNQAKILQMFIDSHSSYYHNSPVSVTEDHVRGLLQGKLLRKDPELATRIAHNLCHPQYRVTAIKVLLARVIFVAIDLRGDSETTLLSPEIVSLISTFSSINRSKEAEEGAEIALCEWRRIGAFLLTEPGAKGRKKRPAGSVGRIKSRSDELDDVLRLFAKNTELSNKRLENLNNITQIGEEFGMLLFCQSYVWELDWSLNPEDKDSQTSLLYSSFRNSETSKPDRAQKTIKLDSEDKLITRRSTWSTQNSEKPRDFFRNANNVNEDHSKRLKNSHPDNSSYQTKRSVENRRQGPRKTSTWNSETLSSGNYAGNGADGRTTMHPEAGSPFPAHEKSRPPRDILHEDTTERASEAGGLQRGNDKTRRSTRVVAFPALLKTTDEYGRKVSNVVRLSEPEVARWLEES
ncbi:hypothetical protein BOTCAL_0369g00020 [Botryotinia calthae]|uniref:Uncharacterized protein n=1 Tax=Botryotinia calthae TaxID=38488 RepID=A0A4Y8CRU7_9HELO|nr:hypothetical protein BOTCAL_0369g00020 [Botryotinia calthae]